MALTNSVLRQNEVRLGDYLLPISGPVLPSLVNTLPGKLTTGKATRADSILADEWVQEDWRGGMLIKQLDESVDLDRFWFSTAATWWRRQMGLPPDVETVGNPTGASTGIDHVIDYGSEIYVLADGKLYKANLGGGVWSFSALIKDFSSPITSWAVFGSMLLLAQGDAGYWYSSTPGTGASWTLKDGSADATLRTDYFCVMDTVIESTGTFGKIFKVSPSGVVTASTDALTWVSTVGGTIPSDRDVVGLIEYRDQNDAPTLFAPTTTGLLSIDAPNKTVYRTNLRTLHAPNTGRDATVWYDGYLYFPEGLSLWKYPRGGQITNVGLDRDDGLPTFVRGRITSLASTPNYLLACIDALSAATVAAESEFLGAEWGTFHIPAASETGFSMIALFNGTGWHCLYLSGSGATGIPDALLSTAYDDQRRLYFAEGPDLKAILLPEGNYDPREDPNARFRASAYHETGWFDDGQSEVLKTSTSVSFRALDVTATEYIDVYYATDDDEENFAYLGRVDGSTVDAFGRVKFLFAGGQGVSWYTLKLRFNFVRDPDDNTVSPWLVFFDARCKKHLDALHSHVFTVDGERIDSLVNTWRALKALVNTSTLHRFAYRTEEDDEEHNFVRIAGVTGIRYGGQDGRGHFTVTVTELEPAEE